MTVSDCSFCECEVKECVFNSRWWSVFVSMVRGAIHQKKGKEKCVKRTVFNLIKTVRFKFGARFKVKVGVNSFFLDLI